MICAIVLAAGSSRRMGTSKALLPFGGSTFVASVVDAFLQAGAKQTIVVIRAGDEQVPAALGTRAVQYVENPEADGDMLSSVRCGLRALPEDVTAVAVSPVDQPSISSSAVRKMFTEFQAGTGPILVPVYRGRRGHPLVFAAHFKDELLTNYDRIGMRGLVQSHPDQVREWTTDDPGVTQDIDTPVDYAASLKEKRA